MKVKRKNIYLGTVLLFLIIIGVVLSKNVSVEKIESDECEINEITPEEEVSDAQLRETIVKLFFVGNNNDVIEEARKIDSLKLIENPYETVFKLLVEGPSQDTNMSYIPKTIKINKIEKNGEILTIDVSEEFLSSVEENEKKQKILINQIYKTMTQFTEINSIKIMVNGSDKCKLNESNISFEQLFSQEL